MNRAVSLLTVKSVQEDLRLKCVSGIYQIRNTVTGKLYIGSTQDLHVRWNQHRALLRSGKHRNRHLSASWKQYGERAFTFRPLLICGKSDLVLFEQLLIDHFKPEYNLLKIANSFLGYKMPPRTAEQRERYRRASLGNKNLVGKPKSEEHKRKLALASKGNCNARGAVRSPEMKARLSALRRGNGRPQARSHRENNAVVRGGLTFAKAQEIRTLYESGVRNKSEIARRYGLLRSSVSRLISGETYRYTEATQS